MWFVWYLIKCMVGGLVEMALKIKRDVDTQKYKMLIKHEVMKRHNTHTNTKSYNTRRRKGKITEILTKRQFKQHALAFAPILSNHIFHFIVHKSETAYLFNCIISCCLNFNHGKFKTPFIHPLEKLHFPTRGFWIGAKKFSMKISNSDHKTESST